MKHRIKNALRALASHIGLKVKFVDYLDAGVHGKLLVRERRILLNARKARGEHFYTILHEIGHFMVHHQNLPRDYCPWYLRQHWKHERIDTLCAQARRYLRFIFNNSDGKEWEADLWAICAFILLAKHLGCRSELIAFLGRHPEKMKIYWLAVSVMAYANTKNRIVRFSKRLLGGHLKA